MTAQISKKVDIEFPSGEKASITLSEQGVKEAAEKYPPLDGLSLVEIFDKFHDNEIEDLNNFSFCPVEEVMLMLKTSDVENVTDVGGGNADQFLTQANNLYMGAIDKLCADYVDDVKGDTDRVLADLQILMEQHRLYSQDVGDEIHVDYIQKVHETIQAKASRCLNLTEAFQPTSSAPVEKPDEDEERPRLSNLIIRDTNDQEIDSFPPTEEGIKKAALLFAVLPIKSAEQLFQLKANDGDIAKVTRILLNVEDEVKQKGIDDPVFMQGIADLIECSVVEYLLQIKNLSQNFVDKKHSVEDYSDYQGILGSAVKASAEHNDSITSEVLGLLYTNNADGLEKMYGHHQGSFRPHNIVWADQALWFDSKRSTSGVFGPKDQGFEDIANNASSPEVGITKTPSLKLQ